jgi:UDP-3-O-[3-hydroxymyristoyl] glucosamine N-acyltransferase
MKKLTNHHRPRNPLVAATLQELADLVHGNLLGDGALVIESARPLAEARPGDVTLLDHAEELERCLADAAVAPLGLTPSCGKALIRVADPAAAFAVIDRFLQCRAGSIDPHAVIHPSATIAADAVIGPYVVIGENTTIGPRCRLQARVVVGANCRVGADTVLHEGVTLYEDTVVGERVVIHARTTIGADGFGYRFCKGQHVKVPQLSHVVIENDVLIGPGACIDRGTFDATVIGTQTQVGPLTQIAHNCRIGRRNRIGAYIGIGGSSIIGDDVVMGDHVGVKDHIRVGAGATIFAHAGVIQGFPAGGRIVGFPAEVESDIAPSIALFADLPAIFDMYEALLRARQETDAGEQDSPATTVA